MKMERAHASPRLFAGFLGPSRGLGVWNRSGRDTEPWENKNLENYPDSYNPYTDEDVVHDSFFSVLSDFSALAALPFGFLIAS